jgi:integrase
VDLQSGFIRLRADQTKSKRARSVFLCAEAIAVLRSVPRDIRCVHRVFANSKGRPLTRSACAMTHDWKAALAEAGIEDFVFHDLRHCFVSRARLSGVPDFIIQKQVGHSGAEMTQRYTTIEERDLLRLAQVT